MRLGGLDASYRNGYASQANSPGVARQLLTFFARPRKVSQERSTLQNRRLRGSLRYSKRWASAELARARTRRLKQSSATPPLRFCVTRRFRRERGQHPKQNRKSYIENQHPSPPAGFAFPSPMPRRAARRARGDVAEDCLSPCSLRTSSAGAARPTGSAGLKRHRGALLFGYFCLGKQDKSDQLPGCPRPQSFAPDAFTTFAHFTASAF